MDSRSRRLPFCLSTSRSSYTSSSLAAASSSSSLGSSRLYSREPVRNNDRFPRASSPYRPDKDKPTSRLLSPTRDYSLSDTRSPSWKLPSVTSSSRSYDRPWADSSLSSRSKVTDSEGRLGISSGLLDASDDADSKRAKLSYSNRGLYSRTASTSVTRSTYSTNGLSSGRVAGEKQGDSLDSSWSSYRLLSRPSSTSSKPLRSTREPETKNEPSLSTLGERRVRTPGLTSSLYQTDRALSTYAQGARPKETTYSPSTFSSTTRESSVNRHSLSSTSQQTSPQPRDFSSRNATHFRNGSSSFHSSQEQTRNPGSSVFSPCSSRTSWYPTLVARPEATPPRPAPESGEPEGRSSTRRLLSRLFSRRSSQDSSSGSSSVRSLEDDSPSTGGESVDSDEGARMSSVDTDIGGAETTPDSLRNHRADLSPIQENNSDGLRSGLARRRLASWREPSVSSSNSSGGGRSSSWLSSSLRGRCPPLLSRLRRYAREESAQADSGVEEGYSHPQHFRRRLPYLEQKALEDDDDDDDDEEEEEEEEEDDDDDDEEGGAVGVDAFGAIRACRIEDETLPELDDASVRFLPRRRVGILENISVSVSPLGSGERSLEGQKETTISSGDQEKLRKIKEKLLLEESDEEEGDLCRICQMREESSSNPLIQPCRCTGSLQYVHQECIKRWLRSKIGSGTNLEAITTCELCKEKLRLNIDNFDVNELYRAHVQSEYDEFISSGLYLVVLLHFCEQRFSDVLRAVDAAGLFNLVRILHEHMDNLETSHGDSDEDGRDGRPSVDFSDLDDDLEEY